MKVWFKVSLEHIHARQTDMHSNKLMWEPHCTLTPQASSLQSGNNLQHVKEPLYWEPGECCLIYCSTSKQNKALLFVPDIVLTVLLSSLCVRCLAAV